MGTEKLCLSRSDLVIPLDVNKPRDSVDCNNRKLATLVTLKLKPGQVQGRTGPHGPSLQRNGSHFRNMWPHDVQFRRINVIDYIKTEVEYNVIACDVKRIGSKFKKIRLV